MAARYVDFMIASISAHSTTIASTTLHAYHYNLSLCRYHVQPTVWQRNSYCIRGIHVTEAIRSCTPISRAPLIYGMPFTHADILIFPVLSMKVSQWGKEEKYLFMYPNCFMQYSGGYMDFAMWCNLVQTIEFYDNFKRIQWKDN